MAVVSDPWFASMQVLDGQHILALEFRERFLKMGDHQRINVIRCLRWHKTVIGRIKNRPYTHQDFVRSPNAKLSGNLGWDDGLCARTAERTLNAVD